VHGHKMAEELNQQGDAHQKKMAVNDEHNCKIISLLLFKYFNKE